MFRPNRFVICLPMSFEANEQTTTDVYFPGKATILRVRSTVVKALAASDAGTITLKNASAQAMTGGQTSHAAAAALNDKAASSPTTNNVVAADSNIQVVSAKTTAGGKVLVFIEYKLTP